MKILIMHHLQSFNSLEVALLTHAYEVAKNPFRYGVDTAEAFRERMAEWVQEHRPHYWRCRNKNILLLCGQTDGWDTFRICLENQGGGNMRVLLSLLFVPDQTELL